MPETAATPEEAEFNALIAEGRRLISVVTPGPWEADGSEIYRADAYDEDTGARVWVGETCNPDEHSLSANNAYLIVWARNELPGLLDRLEQGSVFAKAMLSTLNTQCDIALEATGLHDLIPPDGDGDWQCVWESVADLGNRCRSFEQGLRKAQRRVAELEAQLREEGNTVGRLQDQLRTACTEGADARARAAELEWFVADLAAHGLRCDLNPTVLNGGTYEWWSDYLRAADKSIRDRARAVMGEIGGQS